MNLIDAHTHLHFPDFQNDLEEVMDRAEKAGVRYFINTGTNNETSWQAIELARKYPRMYAAVGVHPHESHKVPPHELAEFDELLKDPKVVAVGEIGLDYFRNLSPAASQRQTLINFFKMAERYQKPIVLHIRDAYDDMIQMLRDFFKLPIHGMSHCFSGTAEQMEQLVHLGLHISFAGPVTYPKNDALREAVRLCPLNRILVETDAPYLPPQSMRGKRNEPGFMVETARQIAEVKGLTLEKFSEQVLGNARHLFGFSN